MYISLAPLSSTNEVSSRDSLRTRGTDAKSPHHIFERGAVIRKDGIGPEGVWLCRVAQAVGEEGDALVPPQHGRDEVVDVLQAVCLGLGVVLQTCRHGRRVRLLLVLTQRTHRKLRTGLGRGRGDRGCGRRMGGTAEGL